MRLAAAVGGECACGTAGKGVEQDCERHREQALRDSYRQSGRCLPEVAFARRSRPSPPSSRSSGTPPSHGPLHYC
jgi:hypothetical protein